MDRKKRLALCEMRWYDKNMFTGNVTDNDAKKSDNFQHSNASVDFAEKGVHF